MLGRILLGAGLLMVSAGGCSGAPESGIGQASGSPAEGSGRKAKVAHPWPMFRGRAEHRGDFRDRATPSGRVRWRAELGERIDASPVIDVDGRVLVATRLGTVFALDGQSGRVLARKKVGGSLWASPALVGDQLIVASASGHVVALHRKTLAETWRIKTRARSFSGITTHGDVAYLCVGAQLLAIDTVSGTISGRATLGANSFTAPAIDESGRMVVVGNRAGAVMAFGRQNLAPMWQARTKGRNDASAAIAEGRVAIGSDDNHLHVFDLETGKSRWRLGGDNWVVSTAALADGRVYFGDDGGRLRAAALADGALLWTSKVGDDLASSPTLIGEWLVHGAHDGKVWMWNAHSGEPAAPAIDVGAAIYASAAVAADGAFVVASHGGAVVLIE